MMHFLAVSMEKAEKGKLISSHIASDTDHAKTKAINEFTRKIKNADVYNFIGENLKGSPTEYPRQPSSGRVSAPDTRIHPSGNSTIAEEAGKVKLPGDERSFMVKPVEEAAGSDNLTTWQGETISRKQILDDVNSIFGATIKKDRIGKKGTNGWHNPKTDIIRTRMFGNPRTVMHEVDTLRQASEATERGAGAVEDSK